MIEKLKILRHTLAHKFGHKIAKAENATHTGYLMAVAFTPHEYVALIATVAVVLIFTHSALGEG